ncbi:MAG: NUDIX domain-containing protein [Candidatus Nanoarchaeia archaeon]|nr:NUDIX domain-containing protein [Candidatus Nanoarchaeia archaeon]MDD5499584.1 NUDIX domain-containing protein [Candidatus Nanoarchaeia archaeon]
MVDKICCLVYSIINDELKFLILHKNNWWNGWEFVRGEIKKEEQAFQAAIREANEETGLNLEKVWPIPFKYSYEYLKGLNLINSNVFCFAAKAYDSIVNLSKEHDHYKWVDYDSALKLLDFEEQKNFLKFFHDSVKN